MKKHFLFLFALCALSVSAWATPTMVTWDGDDVASIDVAVHYGYTPASQTIDGITITANAPAEGDYSHFMTPPDQTPTINTDNGGKLTFAPESSKYLTSIVISCGEGIASYYNLAGNWSWDSSTRELSWSGASTSVDLVGIETGNGIYFQNIQTVEFTIEDLPAPGSTVTWDATDLAGVYLFLSGSQTIKGINVTANAPTESDYCHFLYDNDPQAQYTGFSMNNNGSITFSTEIGRLTNIVINWNYEGPDPDLVPNSGWNFSNSQLTWTSATEGGASSIVLKSNSSSYLSSGPISSIAFTYAGGTPTPTPVATKTITWGSQELSQVSLNCTNVDDIQATNEIKGITASLKKTGTSVGGQDACKVTEYNGNREIWIDNNGELTFESSDGDIVGIEITCDQVWKSDLPTDWTYNDGTTKTITWAGTASEKVILSGDIDFTVTSIEFTVTTDTPAPASSDITWDLTDVQSVNVWMHDGYSEQQYKSQTVKNITVTAKAPYSGDESNFSTSEYQGVSSSYINITNGGKLVFTPVITKLLTKIVVTCSGSEYISAAHLAQNSGWTYSNNKLTWSGNGAASVTLACDGSSEGIYFGGVTSIIYTVIDAPAPTILWEQRQINLVNLYCYGEGENPTTHVIKNIITSLKRTSDEGQWCGFWNENIVISNNGTLKFKSIVGDITKIVITCSSVSHAEYLSTGWTCNDAAKTLTWESTAAEEVSLSGNIACNDITSIEFTYSPAAAPRLGETFMGSYYQTYEITGAHTAKMPQQYISHSLIIPEYEEYDNVRYYITEIDDYAFYNQDELPNAYIGENIARIGAHAFDGCIRMEECIINSDVLDTIGEAAFKDCKIMAYVQCSTEQPPVLGSNAFSGDNYLNHFNVYSHEVDTYKAADGWSALSSKIGAIGMTPAADEIFFYRNQMTRGLYAVTIGATYSTNGEAKVMPYSGEVRSFYPIEYDGTLVISEEVTYMQRPYSITGIGPNAYKDSTRITVVLLPEAMKSIESGAFLNCTGVRNVIFLWDDPTTVTWADADKGLEFATAASGETKIIVPEGKLATYQAWAPAWAGCMIEGELLNVEATADPLHSSRYYRTFYDSQTDYMMPPSVWAHAGYVRGNEFILHPVAYDGQILPKGTPVVLESETPDYRLIAIDGDAPAYTGPNDLIGLNASRTVSFVVDSLNITADQIYVLGKQASVGGDLKVGMGLYRYTGTSLGEKKAFMVLDPSNLPETDSQTAPIRFLFRHEDTATSFENVQKDNDLCTKILRDGQLIIIRDGKEYNAQGLIIK